MGARRPAATVSGPGVNRGFESTAVALSAAITFATRTGGDSTFYVRDAAEEIYGYAESHADGTVSIHRTSTKGEKR